MDIYPSGDCLIIDYADSIDDAEKLMLEDGDRFYPSDYKDDNTMFEAMLAEIVDGE